MRELCTWGGNKALVAAFLDCRVEFLVVGGIAVHFYDESRQFDDLDLMVRQTPENAERVKAALQQAGLNPEFVVAEFMRPTPQQIPLRHLPPNNYYVDIVTPRPDLQTDDEWTNPQRGRLNGLEVPIASAKLLLRMKASSEREKDRDDVRRLSALVS